MVFSTSMAVNGAINWVACLYIYCIFYSGPRTPYTCIYITIWLSRIWTSRSSELDSYRRGRTIQQLSTVLLLYNWRWIVLMVHCTHKNIDRPLVTDQYFICCRSRSMSNSHTRAYTNTYTNQISWRYVDTMRIFSRAVWFWNWNLQLLTNSNYGPDTTSTRNIYHLV